MKHKVSELRGALLDAAVAKAEGRKWLHGYRHPQDWPMNQVVTYVEKALPGAFETGQGFAFMPSQLWNAGGPIIEREQILHGPYMGQWIAMHSGEIVDSGSDMLALGGAYGVGPTPLIAAMRAYVASKFGEEVELP